MADGADTDGSPTPAVAVLTLGVTLFTGFCYLLGYWSDVAYLTSFGLNWEAFTRPPNALISNGALILLQPSLTSFVAVSICGGLLLAQIRRGDVPAGLLLAGVSILVAHGIFAAASNGRRAAEQVRDNSLVAFSVLRAGGTEEILGNVLIQDTGRIAFLPLGKTRATVMPLARIDRYQVPACPAHRPGQCVDADARVHGG